MHNIYAYSPILMVLCQIFWLHTVYGIHLECLLKLVIPTAIAVFIS